MEDKKANCLKKRVLADTICSIIIAVVVLFMAIMEFVAYSPADADYVGHIRNGIYAVIVSVALVLISLILLEVRKHSRPFSKGVIWKLRILAVWIIVSSLLSGVITQIIQSGSKMELVVFPVNTTILLVVVLGVIIGILSEIFVYGHELQNDMDYIA